MEDVVLSPRLMRLRTALQAGDRAALDVFGTDVTQTGTPLVEYDEPGLRKPLVAFIWRDDGIVQDVAVHSALDRGEPDASLMCRLKASDVWWRTYEVNDDLDTVCRP